MPTFSLLSTHIFREAGHRSAPMREINTGLYIAVER
jgi:hypothetical protein